MVERRRLLRRPRFGALLGPDAAGVRQSLVALTLSGTTSLVAGLTLGSATGRLEALPGLLLLVPAAIALRGNIYGALGSRLSTAIHTGTFRMSVRAGTVVGQNVLASMALTLGLSLALAVLAKGVAVGFGIADTISIADLVVVSVVGGVLASVVVLLITLALASGSVRFGWDLDNVIAPLVTAIGDLVTLPALILASYLVGVRIVTPVLAGAFAVTAAVAIAASLRSGLAQLQRILFESLPVLTIAGVLDLVAGISIEKRLDSFVALPALLVFVPGFLETAGALGGILSNRLGTKLHLGLIEFAAWPGRAARRDIAIVFALSGPVFLLVAVVAHYGSGLAGLASPGLGDMVGVALLGGLLATVFVVAVAYYGTMAAVRFGLDPDTYGIPVVTSSLDLVGAFVLVLAIVTLGVT